MRAYPGSAAIADCFDDAATIAAMLRFETALAAAQAQLGIIPAQSAAVIARVADTAAFDADAIAQAVRETGNPAIPLIKLLTAQVAAVDGEAAGHVHFGATSQDVMDCATMLCLRPALALIDADLARVIDALAVFARAHAGDVMVARTLGQHAGPMSVSSKLCGWLRGVAREHRRLRELALVLPLQFAGATGSRAAYGDDAEALAVALGHALSLEPAAAWHSERGFVRALAAALAGAGVALGKMAADLIDMAAPELGEFREGGGDGHGSSSALPHKRNPVRLIGVNAGAARAADELGAVYRASLAVHERATGAWHAEHDALIALSCAAGGAASLAADALHGAYFDTAAMRRNLALGAGRSMSEAVTMALAARIGRVQARARVSAALRRSAQEDISFAEALTADPQVTAELDEAALTAALDPARYLGNHEQELAQTLVAVDDLRRPAGILAPASRQP